MKNLPPATIEVLRGAHVESAHLVDIVVADTEGTLVSAYGEGDRLIFPRSAVKAFQALPLIESGAADSYGFGDIHLALTCSSHQGEPFHISAAREMLSKCGSGESCLECGAQIPENPEIYANVLKEGSIPSAIHNVCSGKHVGFLAFAIHQGIETAGYIDRAHPVQREIVNVMESLTSVKHNTDNCGIDGCSIPTYRVPLVNLANAFAKFSVGENEGEARSKAMIRLRDACMENPLYVAGSMGFCTKLMKALPGRVFGKYGAEGVYMMCFPELGYGVAMKARDGAARAVEVAAATMASKLLQLNDNEADNLQPLISQLVKNKNDIDVGILRMAG